MTFLWQNKKIERLANTNDEFCRTSLPQVFIADLTRVPNNFFTLQWTGQKNRSGHPRNNAKS